MTKRRVAERLSKIVATDVWDLTDKMYEECTLLLRPSTEGTHDATLESLLCDAAALQSNDGG